ncbi:MAG: outer membrane protein assembly factor BamE [Proteobacteria bacterium]|nr:outer membrane protein assembly factor BamE [Pseudomonadota bacterium]
MRILILLLAALALAACKQNPELPAMISPYKIDIQQGNVVTQEMVDKLKAGQTRSQVRFVLGSPLVVDMFRDDRWDYIYLLQRQGKPDERRRLTVLFDGDKLLRIEGDVVATDKALEPPPAPKPAPKPVAVTPPPPKPDAAKPIEKPPVAVKPVEKTPVAATPVAKPQAAAPAAAVKPEPAKSEAASTPAPSAKPDAAKAEVKPDPAKPDAAKADAAKTDPATADDKKDPPKRGLFGRMLDKIGF